MTGFWFTGIMFVLYLFQVVYKATRIPWLQIEMWFCVGITLFFLLASSLAASLGSGAYVAAAVSVKSLLANTEIFTECLSSSILFQFFGFLAMCAYGYDAFLKYRILQGATVVVQRTVITTQVA